MALKIKIKETEFGVGDKIRVVQRIKESDSGKFREASFEGMVIAIRGRDPGKTFVVRKIAEGGVGVERIFPVNLPTIDRIILVKRGVEGVRRAKLYYTRSKAPTEVEMIYKRASIRTMEKPAKIVKNAKGRRHASKKSNK